MLLALLAVTLATVIVVFKDSILSLFRTTTSTLDSSTS